MLFSLVRIGILTSGTNCMSADLSVLRYLIVDDIPVTRDVFGHIFRGLGCHKLLFAQDGQEALKLLSGARQAIDFVLSDFQMPKMNGLELLKNIRCGEKGVSNTIFFGLLTGYSDLEIVSAAFKLDVDCFFRKPISANAIKERLERTLNQDRLLSDPETYRSIDVGILKSMSLDAGADPENLDKSTVKSENNKSKSNEASGTGANKVAIGSIAEGQVLSEDIFTENGQLILGHGQVLNRRLINLLVQLSEVDQRYATIQLKI